MADQKPLLLSFPHSGSNWVRYCIEYFSGKRTPGSVRRTVLVAEGETIIDRRHFVDKLHRRIFLRDLADSGLRPYDKKEKRGLRKLYSDWRRQARMRDIAANRRVILLLRSPYESFCRCELTRPESMLGYLSNVRVFDQCRQDKLLVYYHRLIADFGEVERILRFLGIDYDLTDFDLETHRKKSLQLFDRGRGDATTQGAVKDFSFHSRDLDPERRAALRALCRSELGEELYDRYMAEFDRLHEGAG